jgi:hypothetical protein
MAISKIVQNSLDTTSISLGPKIQSVQVANSTYVVKDDTAVNVAGGYIVVTGQGFQSNCQVLISDGTTSNLACSVSFVSSTTLRAQVPAKSAGTYTVYLINGDGDTAIRVNALQYSAEPTWVTTSPLASQLEDSNVSIQLSASGASSYVLQTGSSLPTGLTLASNGLISGTVNTNVSVDTTFNFTVEAIDAENQETPKAFSVSIVVADPNFYRTVLLLDGNGTNGANNNVFRDSSNNNFAITRNGNTTQGSFSPFSPSGWGNLLGAGAAVKYTASGVIPQPLTPWSTGTGTGTIEAWIYPTAVDTSGATNHNMSTIVGIGDTYFAFGIRGDSKLRLYWWTGGQNYIDSTGTIPGLNQWIHVAVTRNNGNIEFFINGVSAGTSASYTGLSSWSSSAGGEVLQIGQNNGSGETAQFYGNISNLRFSNNVRTVTLPTSNYTSDANTLMLTCLSNRFRDIGPSNYALTTTGAPRVINFTPFAPAETYSAATHGGSAYFDGTGDYLDLGNGGTDYDFGSGDFTVECWFNPTARPSQHQAITHKGHVSNNNQYDWRLYWGTVDSNDLLYWEGTGSLDTGSNKLIRNAWNHIAVVRSGANLYLYLNGTRASTTASGTMGTTYSNIYVGTANIGGAGVAPTNGYISELNIIKGTAKYTGASITPPTSPSVPVSGTESLLNFTNAGIYDATTKNIIETIGTVNVNTTISKYGTGSIFFNGSNGYLLSYETSHNNFGTGDFTLEAWIRFNTVGNGQILSAGDGNNATAFYWQYYSNALQFGAQGNAAICNTSWSPTAGQWYHVAVSRSGTSVRQFVDGTQLGTTVTSSVNFAAGPTWVGNAGAGYFNGNMDDIRITKGLARYTGNFTPATGGLQTR